MLPRLINLRSVTAMVSWGHSDLYLVLIKLVKCSFRMFYLYVLATESEDEDSDVEEDVAKETESTDTQCVGSLQAFRTLGCELTGVAKSMLCSDAPVGKLATAECHHLLKVNLRNLLNVYKLCV